MLDRTIKLSEANRKTLLMWKVDLDASSIDEIISILLKLTTKNQVRNKLQKNVKNK